MIIAMLLSSGHTPHVAVVIVVHTAISIRLLLHRIAMRIHHSFQVTLPTHHELRWWYIDATRLVHHLRRL